MARRYLILLRVVVALPHLLLSLRHVRYLRIIPWKSPLLVLIKVLVLHEHRVWIIDGLRKVESRLLLWEHWSLSEVSKWCFGRDHLHWLDLNVIYRRWCNCKVKDLLILNLIVIHNHIWWLPILIIQSISRVLREQAFLRSAGFGLFLFLRCLFSTYLTPCIFLRYFYIVSVYFLQFFLVTWTDNVKYFMVNLERRRRSELMGLIKQFIILNIIFNFTFFIWIILNCVIIWAFFRFDLFLFLLLRITLVWIFIKFTSVLV